MLAGFATASLADSVGDRVNINNATVNELRQFKGIGNKVARRIVAFRDEHGPFKNIDEIKKVKGIGDKIFENIKQYIDVGEEE